MVKKIDIILNSKKITVDEGTCVYQVLEKSSYNSALAPLGIVINNRIDGLYYKIKNEANIETVDISRREGMDIYRRSASTILYAAMKDIAPNADVVVGQSIATGYFFEINGIHCDASLVQALETRMHEIVDANSMLVPEWRGVEDAIALFDHENAKDKIKLLKQLRRSEVPIISLGNYHAYAFGPLVYRTGLIDQFNVFLYEHGIVLNFPNEHGHLTPSIPTQSKLFASYVECKRWNELMNVKTVPDLNERCMGRTAGDLVSISEALHEKKIGAIADTISNRSDTRLVLIAGPSSSGKTTFSKRLTTHLKILGYEPIAISMDNYYLNREDTPRHADGSYNFECVEALDIALFDDHMKRLMRGEKIMMPHYCFQAGKRDISKTTPMQLKENQIIIAEGIHGLNDLLTPNVAENQKYKIFVSALTQLCLDNHNRIFTTDARLCRRIVRDRLFRGTTAEQTIAGWGSVRAGEMEYIFPYQEKADVIFNSALAYEHSLLKPYAERYLAEVPRDHPSFVEASRLARFFSFFIPILVVEVPRTSILREFVGGSAFKYS